MKIIYIAHPISGNVQENLNDVARIARMLNLSHPNIVPIAPYFLDCHALNDDIKEERERGIKNDTAILKSGMVDEIWLFGNKISAGMKAEIALAKELNIPVRSMTIETKIDLELS